MIPIPKRLLSQTATVSIPITGGYGGEYEEPLTIKHVRFEASANIAQNDYQLQAPLRGKLFIDAVNSEPARELPAGSLVTVDNEIAGACVHECSPILDGFGRVHHWEVALK